jgi:dihydroorotase
MFIHRCAYPGLRGERLTKWPGKRRGYVAYGQMACCLIYSVQAMQYASTALAVVRPQEISLTNDGVAHDGEVANRLGLPTVPMCRNNNHINIILLAKETGVRVHLCRISCAEG